uniref:Putative toxin-antitoxin system toxin component, PIN family n=1 Tax=Candidatus Kentrum sp. UNK TaxID=2126344 RepID=A0A451AIF5_9GAMM|nr:MAG: putative toxin-antitoxin system toxin component, PIN family [Candidatus Kentron sp. UNK]VFK71572.1 MAG: putative toxin-antitoxin system toxin component, PIN family [Candidatus Kentron sp. UNK]
MRTFLDTNVLAAAFATRGFCSNLFQQVLESHELVSSLGILAELERILRKKFKIPASQIEEILAFLRSNSRLSEPHEKKPYRITDPDDMPHLSAAENAQCDVFVTGDKELHALNPIGAMQVLSPRDFWEMLSEK